MQTLANLLAVLGGAVVIGGAVRFVEPMGSDDGARLAIDLADRTTAFGVFHGSIDLGGGPLVQPPGTNEGLFLARFDRDGRLLFRRGFAPTDLVVLRGLATDLRGRSVVFGELEGEVDLGAGPISSAGSPGDTSLFVAGFGEDGSTRFSRAIHADVPVGIDLALDAEGDPILALLAFGPGDLGGGGDARRMDLYLAKLDDAGATRWVRRFATTGSVQGYALGADVFGGIHLAGGTDGAVDLGRGVASGMFVATFDARGELRALRQLSDARPPDAFLDALAVTPWGEGFVAGEYTGALTLGGRALPDVGASWAYFVARLDPFAHVAWAKSFAVASSRRPWLVALGADAIGDPFLTASRFERADFGGGAVEGSVVVMLDRAGRFAWQRGWAGAELQSSAVGPSGRSAQWGEAAARAGAIVDGVTVAPRGTFFVGLDR